MEPNFQTSFIPKKPMIEERFVAPRPIGLLTVVSIFIFFTILLASAGLYFYQGFMASNISKMEGDLVKSKDAFESAGISRYQLLDKRINASNEVLSKHIAVSPIFKILQDITMKTVQYTNFSYNFNEKENKINVKMKGIATGYRSIALQADLFTTNENLIDPIFSNPSLDDKGQVIFDLDFSVDSNLLNYKQMLKNNEEVAPNPTPDSTTPLDSASKDAPEEDQTLNEMNE